MKYTNFFQKLFIFFLACVFSSMVLAQDTTTPNPPVQPKKPSISKKSGLPKYPPLRKAKCKACDYAAIQYDHAYDALMSNENLAEAFENVMKQTDQELNKIESQTADLKKQFIKHPSTTLRNQIADAEKKQQELSRKYGRKEQSLSETERKYDDLFKEMQDRKANLEACEAEFCNKKVGMLQSTTPYFATNSNFELGILAGNQNISPAGNINTPTTSYSGSNSQNSFQGGVQARLYFGMLNYIRAFILLNAISLNATNTLLNLRTDSFSNSNSYLRLRTFWIAHLLLGLQSAMIFNRFNVSGGLGEAFINKQFQSAIAENVTTTNTQNQTSFGPSAMLSLDYHLCQACLWAHDLILSGQVTADRYPSINSALTTPLGNNYRTNLNSNWQFSEALVLSMQF